MTGWLADYADPDNFLRVAAWRRRGGWRHREYDDLLEQARRDLEPERRLALYRRADRILVNEAPVVPVIYARVHKLVKPWVTIPTFADYIRFQDVIIDPH
jgi:ABC-type oligopeptide transport system substrate-binding subunit